MYIICITICAKFFEIKHERILNQNIRGKHANSIIRPARSCFPWAGEPLYPGPWSSLGNYQHEIKHDRRLWAKKMSNTTKTCDCACIQCYTVNTSERLKYTDRWYPCRQIFLEVRVTANSALFATAITLFGEKKRKKKKKKKKKKKTSNNHRD